MADLRSSIPSWFYPDEGNEATAAIFRRLDDQWFLPPRVRYTFFIPPTGLPSGLTYPNFVTLRLKSANPVSAINYRSEQDLEHGFVFMTIRWRNAPPTGEWVCDANWDLVWPSGFTWLESTAWRKHALQQNDELEGKVIRREKFGWPTSATFRIPEFPQRFSFSSFHAGERWEAEDIPDVWAVTP